MTYLGSVLVSLFLSMMSSMNSASSQAPNPAPSGAPLPAATTQPAPAATPVASAPAPAPEPSAAPAPGAPSSSVLVYGGQGTDASFLNCLMGELSQAGLDPQQLDSSGLASLSPGDLSSFSALIFPEGNASVMGSALTPSTQTAIRTAVQSGGMNFLGLGNGALLGLGAGAGNPYAAAIPVALNLLQGLSSGSAGGSSSGGSAAGALQNIFGLFANGQPALSQTPTSNGGGVSVLMPSPAGGMLSCGQLPQVFSTGTGGSSNGTPTGQPISNPILSLIQHAFNRTG